MLGSAKLMAFVATARPEESRRFYEGVLGLRFVEDGPFALVFDSAGITLRIQKVEKVTVIQGTNLGWQVDDIISTIRQLTAAGVVFNRYDGMPQDDLGVWTAPDGAAVAWFNDPDGNNLSLTQFAESPSTRNKALAKFDAGAITNALIDFGRTLPADKLIPIEPEAARFVVSNPFAFALASCLDRGAKAEIIWTIPFDFFTVVGHLDPRRLRDMSLPVLADLVASLPRKPRYTNDAPKTIHDLATIVCDEFDGDAAKIWQGRTASEVRRTFLRVHGVGEGIASMAVLLIEKAFDIRFPDAGRPSMDIKPDVHTVRVLYRLGASDALLAASAIAAARKLNPSFPGAIDAPLWILGREYCHQTRPNCPVCPMNLACPKVGV